MGSCSVTRFVRAVILASVVLCPCEVTCARNTESTLIARGQVANQDGKPISNARVMIFAANGREFLPSTFCVDCTVLENATDEDGLFQFAIRTNDNRFLHYGDVKILVVADGFETQIQKFPLSRLLVDLPFEFSLAKAIPIRLRLLDPSGNPVANTSIAPARIVKYRLNYHVAQKLSRQTDSNGFVVLDHYRPNTMPQIYVTSKRYGKQQIELRDNAVRPLELRAGIIEDVEIISSALRKASSSRLEK